MGRARVVAIAAMAGFLAGTLVLGIGGRLAMRVVAYTDPAPTRFTLAGALQVIGAGAAWGTVTGPLLLALDGMHLRWRWASGLIFGAVVLGLATLAVGLVAGFGTGIDAPPAFVLLSAVVFPILFLTHGVLVDVLVGRWRRRGRAARSSARSGRPGLGA